MSAIPDLSVLWPDPLENCWSSRTLPPLCRALAAAAHSLSQLAAAAAPALAQLDSPPLWLSQQIDVGCSVLDSLNRLADQAPQLSAQTARQMEAACALVLGPGRALLQALTAVVQSGGEGTAEWLHGACDRQLLLWIKMVDSVWRCQPAAPAFANSIRQPAFLPWLAAVSAALPAAFPGGQPGEWMARRCDYLAGLHAWQRCASAMHGHVWLQCAPILLSAPFPSCPQTKQPGSPPPTSPCC